MAAAAFFCAKACVTATLASDQAAAAEDELQQHCSTAGDEILTTSFGAKRGSESLDKKT